MRISDVTMLLATSPIDDSDKKAIKYLKIDEEDKEYIGILYFLIV